jgi:predicted RNase H-like nuclease
MTWVAGVDGCRGGWVAALMRLDGAEPPRIRVVGTVAEIADAPEAPAIVAVDIPIGLPERIEGPGRAPERLLRPLLGSRAASVFSMPARAAVYAGSYAEACATARALSTPPRALTIQGFNILPKVREVDALLRARPELRERVFEVHPEAVFRALNAGAPLDSRKVEAAGLDRRRALLLGAGLPRETVEAPAPRPAKPDDLLDALAALVGARAIAQGEAESFPDPPERDAHGIPVAIWAPRPRTRP